MAPAAAPAENEATAAPPPAVGIMFVQFGAQRLAMMMAADSDGDGADQQGPDRGDARAGFARLDRNGDGPLSDEAPQHRPGTALAAVARPLLRP
jgi:hypothetical protein